MEVRIENPGARASRLVAPADLSPVAEVLERERDTILGRWLVAVADQPFHRARPEAAVADHIPALFDAMVEVLRSHSSVPASPTDNGDDTRVLDTASSHAGARFAQKLSPTEVAIEFRVLRQEIWRSLREHLDPTAPTADVLAAELLINDRLDGAIQTALSTLAAWEASHHQIAAELTARRAQLAAIVESSDDAIFSHSLDGLITSWNRGAERLYGYVADAAIGQPVRFVVWPDRQAEFDEMLARVQRGERIEPHETVHVCRDAKSVEVLMSVSPMHDDTGRVIGASTIARDISERNALMRERETFFAAVTHDLKNPLSAVRGMLQLLRRAARTGPLSSEELMTRLDAINNASRRLGAQLEQLEDVVRLREGHHLVLRRRRSDLVPLILRVVADHQAANSEHEIACAMEVAELVGDWDEQRLERVLDNLLGNAIKFSPAGGRIDLAVERDGQSAVLRLRDRGLGIPPADLPYIFEWFRRGSNVASTIAGTGVGLAATREMVEQHGGSVTAESEPGRGATFTIRLPLDGDA